MNNPSTSDIISRSNIDIFPSDVLKWMKANAEPLMALKLMQVCKYFKHKKFPYLIVTSLCKNNDGSWNYSKFNDNEIIFFDKLNNFPDKSFWILDFLNLYEKVDPISLILSKIAVCTAAHLYFANQNLTLDEFKELSSSGTFEYVHFSNIVITENNNEPASMESILQCLPNVKNFYIDEIIPSFSSPEAASNITVAKMKSFEIYLIRENFNFQTFTEFMKVHPSIHCQLLYNVHFDLTSKYMQQLQQYIDKVIADNSIQYPPPLIYFNGQKSPGALDKLYARYIEQHGEQ